jgi:myo-inositol-1(or 4)-monophosphatase
MAAGLLIVREAGGLVEAVRAGDDIFGSGSILCANEPLFPHLAATIRAA